MKKVMTKAMMMFVFVLSIFVGNSVVANAGPIEGYSEMHNMNVTGDKGTMVYVAQVEEGSETHPYYIVNDFSTAVLKLKYIRNNGKEGGKNYDKDLQYSSNISLVVCKTNNICTTVNTATLVNDDAALKGDGYSLPLNVFEDGSKDVVVSTQENVPASALNGTNLAELQSTYGNVISGKYVTMYLVVDYVTTTHYKKGGFLGIGGTWVDEVVNSYTEVIKIVELSSIGGGVSISSVTEDGKHKATVTASVNLKEVSYITTTESYDFNQLASEQGKSIKEVFNEKAGLGGNTLTTVDVSGIKGSVPEDSQRVGREYVCNVETNVVDGTNYYVYAEDELGNAVVYNIKNVGESNPAAPLPTPGDEVPANPSNTKVGRIILIVLISVFVLSAVLVIVQRIVDYKRRLY